MQHCPAKLEKGDKKGTLSTYPFSTLKNSLIKHTYANKTIWSLPCNIENLYIYSLTTRGAEGQRAVHLSTLSTLSTSYRNGRLTDIKRKDAT